MRVDIMKYYVSISAPSGGDGSKTHPFQHINDAAKIAMPGDEVHVAPGIYREYVNPVHAWTSENPITYLSTDKLGARITGAEQIKNWTRYEQDANGHVWYCRVPNTIFGDYNPYTTLVYGDWYFAKPNKHTGCVYLNDRALYEAESLEACVQGEVSPYSWSPEDSIYKWYATQDEEADETIIYANFQDSNPNEENVEINVRRMCFFPEQTGRDYHIVRGFFRKEKN